ncbi:hypothetical protein OOZ63_10380 [Paucibacter sp. PLA-PC-4]|uniref:hypothetical protein n=1 Tax=Paucibacter sp. PLA-PC-4 TaxID=2993655 RepID=UPI0022496D4D|nr:hypothetical protein [Paucibacter sp. PLA-PC-4]MCX2862249.1 hypothetical protein [Paucibacter sp. PLA-PC-4]
MTYETITVKVKVPEFGGASPSQSEWYEFLQRFCDRLLDKRIAEAAQVNVVFPGNPNPAMATIFTLEIEARPRDLERPLHELQGTPGIQYAHLAPSRRSMTAAP